MSGLRAAQIRVRYSELSPSVTTRSFSFCPLTLALPRQLPTNVGHLATEVMSCSDRDVICHKKDKWIVITHADGELAVAAGNGQRPAAAVSLAGH